MMASDFIQNKFLGVTDLKGKEPIVTISRVEVENMRDGTSKLAIYINGHPKGILLNKVNTRSIQGMYGDDTDGWIGNKIKLVAVWTEYQGKPTQGLRIMAPGVDTDVRQAPPKQTLSQMASTPAAFEDEVPF